MAPLGQRNGRLHRQNNSHSREGHGDDNRGLSGDSHVHRVYHD